MDHYAVFGHPVGHSLSPRIQAAFAAQAPADADSFTYAAIDVPDDDFEGALERFVADGARGANVTVPFKGRAAERADARDGLVERAAAANTLRFEGGRIEAFNTDGLGLVRDLTANLGVDLAGARIGLVGAGGAAAGVIEPLLSAGVAGVRLANRTAARAEALAERFAALGTVEAVALDAVGPVDVLINATAASLAGETLPLDPEPLRAGTFCYDMMYADAPTPFLHFCLGAGVRHAVDGLGMLVEQAAEAFELWRGRRPATAEVLAALRPAGRFATTGNDFTTRRDP